MTAAWVMPPSPGTGPVSGTKSSDGPDAGIGKTALEPVDEDEEATVTGKCPAGAGSAVAVALCSMFPSYFASQASLCSGVSREEGG